MFDNSHAYTIEQEQYYPCWYVVTKMSRTKCTSKQEAQAWYTYLAFSLAGADLLDSELRIETGY